ncbi:Ger(x)C family spore germination protein [Neobacillus kokaensis]|uniref:Germination protein GerC n=1 Tax=Neobacillus kokaensis TaxID=2759023 RepID=A0ABQ3N1L8_9BACI|nr:Ger(x)C family spore germination protein [Neobacillus kokaensis]GHH97984.1 germination protein GerC [Neobacillus kokaensis]
MIKKVKIAAVLGIIFSALFFGRVPSQILDDLNLASAVGYDFAGENRIKTTSVVPVFNPDKSVGNETFTATDELSKETLRKMNLSSARRLVNGKLEVALYSKELAKRGIGDLLDTLQRDPSISERLLVAVADGEAEQLLTNKYGDRDTGVFLSMLIDQNIKAGLVPTYNLHLFLNNYYSKLSDPFLPLIGQKGKDVQIKGIALFKGDRFLKTLHEDHQFVFKALLEKLKSANYKLRLKEDEFVVIENVNSKHRVRVRNGKHTPEISIGLRVKGIIREKMGKTTNKREIHYIKKQMKKQLEKQGTEMIRSFQQSGIDPLHLGNEVRSRTRNFNTKKWLAQYPDIKITIKVDVDILEKGVID